MAPMTRSRCGGPVAKPAAEGRPDFSPAPKRRRLTGVAPAASFPASTSPDGPPTPGPPEAAALPPTASVAPATSSSSSLSPSSFIRTSEPHAPTQLADALSIRHRTSFRSTVPPPCDAPTPAGSDPPAPPPPLLPPTATPEEMRALLRQHFGFPTFRLGQEEVVSRIAAGRSTLAVLPTGMGKSLCYQLAALLWARAQPSGGCFVLVVSPLLSLMADQVRKLPSCLRGVCLSSAQTAGFSAHQVVEEVKAGRLQLLFVSPERLVRNAAFLESLRTIAHRVAFVCLDEAHCISEWGHNYRTAYLHVAGLLRDRLNVRCVLALTATCSPAAVRDVCVRLRLDPPDPDAWASCRDPTGAPRAVCSGGAVLCAAVRPNLRLGATLLPPSDDPTARHRTRFEALRRALEAPVRAGHSVIVYTHTKKDADEVADHLRVHVVAECAAYHADKTAEDRRRVQMRFMRDELQVVVATVAFGMGIDKPDVRAVVHFTCPPSLEAYAQEIGRAGRDGGPAVCHVLVDRHDFWLHSSKAHTDVLDPAATQRLCDLVFNPDDRDHNTRLLAAGQEVLVPLLKTTRG